MALIEQVKRICDRLAPFGWRELLLQHGLDITATNLRNELTKELPKINRRLKGFEDFAFEGKRGIEPRNPARSLLFHAFASPNVIQGVKSSLTAFPTLAEIEIVENFVYAISPPSLMEIQVKAEGSPLAIVVFACEYRPAPETVHRQHADLCFSRTGVARVGTNEAIYGGKNRGFLPFVAGQPNAIRVLPVHYSAYIAALRPGNKDTFGPMRFQPDDQTKNFWVPLHKLFNGAECIRGLNLNITLKANHVNEKLRRIHLQLVNAGWSEPDISKPPFIFTQAIAEFAKNPDFGTGLLIPVVHPKLVEPAQYKGKPLTFRIPPKSNYDQSFSSSFYIRSTGNARHAPEYVHARHQILPNGQIFDLNQKPDVAEIVDKGDYYALHYIDFTGDGWIEGLCPELAVQIPRRVPAYSIVTAPDFFPNTDQRELLEWSEQSVPTALRNNIWRIEPKTLSDQRLAPNVELKNAGFRKEDQTVSAIVSFPIKGSIRQMQLNVSQTNRHSYLPDNAAGVFAPGWDTSLDITPDGVEHLAAYGLGSPFPEDAKLCAALSTFWPAVAPDAARTYAPNPNWPTVSPLTDEEIGQVGNLPWDGVTGGKRVAVNGKQFIEYSSFDHTDYVKNTLDNKFSLALTGKINLPEYQARVLAMAYVYQALGATNKGAWSVFSFRKIASNDAELSLAQTQTSTTLEATVYRFEVYRPGTISPNPNDFRKILVEIKETVILFVSPLQVLLKRGDSNWEIGGI